MKQAGRRGFSLVEVMMALGISAFAMTTLMALVPIGLASNSESKESLAAMDVARKVASDLRMARLESGVYVSPQFEARLDKSVNLQDLAVAGRSADLSGQKVRVSVLPGSPDRGSDGFYEVAVRVFWGLADPSRDVPEGYSKFVDLYVGFVK